MVACDCSQKHVARRVVLTGGPGAGKTATLELIRRSSFCEHVQILPESAGIVFGGGFPRRATLADLRILQAWESHPRRFIVEATPDFLTKAASVLELMRAELPECCRHHVVAELDEHVAASHIPAPAA